MTPGRAASYVVDCPTGLAGDMLLAACLDLGVSPEVIHSPLGALGFENGYALRVEEARTAGLRGLRLEVEIREDHSPHRHWGELRKKILTAALSPSLRDKVMSVFTALAEAEAAVHGIAADQVHFHEVGAMDSLVDVVGVCAALEHLQPVSLWCVPPPAGRGTVATAHGVLPVPAPAVLELARRHGVELRWGDDWPEAELTTPTGLALMAVLADGFGWPEQLAPEAVGTGLGHRQLDRPNLLRLIRQHPQAPDASNQPRWQDLIVQEAWIDDGSAEALAWLIQQLRDGGALDVASSPLQMKKGRPGTAVTALVLPDQAADLRQVWWRESPTLGLRERRQGRWVLPRRRGVLATPWGELAAKQTLKPDGTQCVKPERDALQDLAHCAGLSPDALWQELSQKTLQFNPEQEWTC
jgi:hypothetical protein